MGYNNIGYSSAPANDLVWSDEEPEPLTGDGVSFDGVVPDDEGYLKIHANKGYSYSIGDIKSPDYPKYDDAAAFYPKLNIDKKMIDAWSKLINKQGGKILMTSSPMGSSWFYEKYKHSNPNKEKQMNKTIAELFKDSKGSDMMLVNMWFPMIGETRADVILWEGKQGELLAKANELEAESKK